MSEAISRIQSRLSPGQRERLRRRLSGGMEREPDARIGPRAAGANRVPLSAAQRRAWFLTELMPDSPQLNLPVGLRLRGDLDLEALRVALDDVVAAHEILRTGFEAADGGPVQVIHPAASVPVAFHDLTGLHPAAAQRRAPPPPARAAPPPLPPGR